MPYIPLDPLSFLAMDLFDIAPEGWWDDVGTLAADVAATDDTEDPTEDATDNLLFLTSQQYQNEAAL